MDLLDRAEIDTRLEGILEDGLRRFRIENPAVQVIAWYHDAPLWYVKEQAGPRTRRIQLALVQTQNGPAVEVTGDYLVKPRHRRRVLTPTKVSGRLLRYLILEDLRSEALLRALTDVWAALSEDLEMTHPSELSEIAIPTPPQPRTDLEAARVVSRLTERERQVLGLLVSGRSGPGIARELDVSENTVRTHVQSILAKLQVHSRLEAVAFATRAGIRSSTRGKPQPDQ